MNLSARTVRLFAQPYDFWVDVHLLTIDRRCLAFADLAGEPSIGPGSTICQAVRASLAPLGVEAAEAFAASVPEDI